MKVSSPNTKTCSPLEYSSSEETSATHGFAGVGSSSSRPSATGKRTRSSSERRATAARARSE